MLSLIDGGDLRPTARRVAEQANISLRSVFQHFADLESLYAAVADAQAARLAWLISQDAGEGPLAERTRSFVERRAELLETITPVRRAALLQEPFSRSWRAAFAGRMRWRVRRSSVTFAPELGVPARGDATRLVFALDIATNWSAWDGLRRMNGLSIEESKRVMEATIRALLRDADSGAG